jgi:hypothetical protein
LESSIWPDVSQESESREAKWDRIGTGVSLAVLIAALVIIVISLISAPSFEKCGAMASKSERIVCYEQLRDELLKSPAK